MSSSVRRALRVPVEVDERVNVARGDVSWSRWVLRAVEQRLEREGPRFPGGPKGPPKFLSVPPLSDEVVAALDPGGETVAQDLADYDLDGMRAHRRQVFGNGHAVGCSCAVCKALA